MDFTERDDCKAAGRWSDGAMHISIKWNTSAQLGWGAGVEVEWE
jgi:hypothetical protein